ncbi:hypothetical protein [Jannaschia ovalis]|uniref:Uncharacterized protein n=1 Tax=Jannaschia ovalis TaxID=3038773 RepID=A0ABY8LDS8_9RHOB|nr:hypothetical protein [Jannaschia sp. GRR-S6-38]WGH78329.1 hypothetical protein P8627_15090 [Jannaschia sp. GRR-S6-38]
MTPVLIFSAAVALTAPAAAQVAPGFGAALDHFNISRELGDKVLPSTNGEPVRWIPSQTPEVARVLKHFNETADTPNQEIGTGPHVTVVSGRPAYGEKIFMRIWAEREEDR